LPLCQGSPERLLRRTVTLCWKQVLVHLPASPPARRRFRRGC